jgi:predicted dehydrogenase
LINRILLVGLGSIGTRHLRLARAQFPNADIRILRHKLESTPPEFSNGSLMTIQEVIAFAPQIAIISNPSTFHIAIAQPLAEMGVHILVEKPLSASLEGIRRLIETSKEHNTVLMVGYNLRFSTSLQYFRDLLRQGAIGEFLSVRCEVGQFLPSWRPQKDYRQGVSARKELGGGALLELSHELDYLGWIFGDIDWVRATLIRQSKLEIDVEDSAHLAVGFLRNNDGHQLVGTINLDFIRHDQTRVCTVIGEKGSLHWNGLTGEVALFEKNAKDWKILFVKQPQEDDTYFAEWQDFLYCVNENIVPTVTGEDGLRVVEVIEAAHLSAPTGAQVAVIRTHQENEPI